MRACRILTYYREQLKARQTWNIQIKKDKIKLELLVSHVLESSQGNRAVLETSNFEIDGCPD
jgi:hypothetical protein